MMDPDLELAGFERICRLFPLPEIVLLPHCVLPLHVFEPRYRQMIEDALAGDGLIAIVKIRDEAEGKTGPDPPIESIACLGKIFDHHRLPDGRFKLLLVGLKRVGIGRELASDRLYRTAEVQLLDDVETREEESPVRRQELMALFRALCLREGRSEPEIASLLDMPIRLGVLSDLIGHYLGLAPAIKQEFLAEVRVEERARFLTGALRRLLGASHPGRSGDALGFPPPFSEN